MSIKKWGGYLLKNSTPINKKIEDNNTSRILQDYYYKNEYIIYTYKWWKENIFDMVRADKNKRGNGTKEVMKHHTYKTLFC